ncbi:MAG: pilus assembly protein PilY [Comamonadaceae bacterium]|nr:pilus assembly protein PilY [Comamonadaceae bacterium]
MNTKIVGQGVRNWAGSTLIGLSLSLGGGGAMAQVNLAQTPLFLTSSAEPNIMFILDDSGSMHWEMTPDDVLVAEYIFPRAAGNYGGSDYTNRVASSHSELTQTANVAERATAAAMRSFHVNKSYYNPAITYRPWVKPAGMAITAVPAVAAAADRFPNASPTAAPHHPIRNTGVRNLTVDNTETATWRRCAGVNPRVSCADVSTGNQTFYPATYFQYDGVGPVFNRDSYLRVQINSGTALYVGHGRQNRSDCALASAATCTYAEEIQNFANWYTYYRSRMLASQAGIGAAFVTQPEEMRVGFGSINQGSTTVDGVATRTVKRGVRPFSGSNREGFFSELYLGNWPTSNTPLRRALNDAGQYFSRSDNLGPWGAVPGENNTTNQLTCRQSFSILMTDGYWTNDTASQAGTAAARENVDGTNGATITGPALVPGDPIQSFTYNSATPFTDAHSNTLADVAMYYWSRDLRTDLENRVPASSFNPAFWQHMVTYGVALGVTGTINPNTALGAITSATPPTINWPDPTASNPAKIDDLLHAAVNSRGGFFSAADPATFASELSGVLDSIVARTTAAGTAAAASSAVLQSDSLLYNASFRSGDWSGNLEAKELNASTGLPGDLAWDAEALLAARDIDDRRLFTRTNGGVAVELTAANLGAAQTAALAVNPPGAPATTASVADRVTWLRGGQPAGLRERTFDGDLRRIGDLIGSDPQYLSKRDFGYSLLPGAEGAAYRTFRSSPAYQSRPDALLVGSNGGFLHAFHARTGQELFAYMPSELLLPAGSDSHAQINELMRTDYTHRYYVDGTAAVGDAYVGGAWRTMLVGTMGAGGRTVFALDVTNPASFSETNVRWEFTHADLGFGATKPKIVRLADGRWAAVFGNGVNSATHRPRLFVVDLANGNLIYNIALGGTGDGSAADPNGLSPVETTDWPANNLSLTNAYAGDLHGNLWRVSFPTPPAAPVVTRLFRAVDSASPAVRQPITARPRVAVKPGDTADVVVLFGTGSFFRVGDDTVVNPQVQSLYGIFDSPTPAGTIATRGNLLTQTITSNAADVIINGTTYPPGSLRFITENTLGASNRGWVINLPAPGERVISEATFPTGAVQDRVRFTTLIPDDDPCRSGRNGFLMDISLLSGGRYESPVFDLDGDGVFDNDDNAGGNPVSGIGGPTGETLTTIRDPNRDIDNLYSGDGRKIGAGRNTAGPVGRQSWRQLR